MGGIRVGATAGRVATAVGCASGAVATGVKVAVFEGLSVDTWVGVTVETEVGVDSAAVGVATDSTRNAAALPD